MSEEIKNIKDEIMNKIHNKEIKIKPKIYFVFGSILTLIGLMFSVTISIFMVSLIRFSFRSHGMMSNYRFDQMVNNFPWWTFLFTILSLTIGLYLIKKYEFSYKMETWMMILAFIFIITLSGILVDVIGVNDTLRHRGPMQKMMNNYLRNTPTQDTVNLMKIR